MLKLILCLSPISSWITKGRRNVEHRSKNVRRHLNNEKKPTKNNSLGSPPDGRRSMGCVQTKPSQNSPPKGLEKLKQQNGYVPSGGGSTSHRWSTSQRYSQESQGGPRRPESRKSHSGRLSSDVRSGGSDGHGGSGGGGDVKFGSGNGSGGTRGKLEKDGALMRKGEGSGDDQVELVDGWPKWLIDNVPKRALRGLVPRSADSYDKIDKVGQGTYSNVYKAWDRDTGKLVALKKVRFDTSEPESIKFMAREIMILRELDHPNVVKLEGLATSRMQFSLYLVFDFMVSDLQRIITRPEGGLTEPQVKCYMHQLLSGLQHCHDKGILHRDIKGSNLLIDKTGMLKIADFGLANYYRPRDRRPLTNRVVTLWYRAPELLLGATDYGVSIDLWSAGCLLAEMFAGHPIMPGRNEVEQLHKIFKLCGTPPEDYWKKMKLPSTFRPRQLYKSNLTEIFREFPDSSVGLLSSLLSLDPASRGSASLALQHEFFYTSPLACDLSGLPIIYQEKDEFIKIYERKMRRKAKRQTRSQRERRRKDSPAVNETGNGESTKEEQEQRQQEQIDNQKREPWSSTSSSSSGLKDAQPEQSAPTVLLYPGLVNQSFKKSPEIDLSPDAGENGDLPQQPVLKPRISDYRREKDGMYRSNQVGRSTSSREFRSTNNQRKNLGWFAVED
ncbi:probable serine/threonine-protein kinase At1g54610 [Rhodamnia argentea]|uniref:Probable serine/threonine-protein kinase At1g54610 n=1 Tax=Rhodamnia argentea TaxID=178133 RepID=A0A8B8QAI1_9MYRT|nr:probable serine/threonine-protein kinase At1g54610 [Rhodamnia argentea]